MELAAHTDKDQILMTSLNMMVDDDSVVRLIDVFLDYMESLSLSFKQHKSHTIMRLHKTVMIHAKSNKSNNYTHKTNKSKLFRILPSYTLTSVNTTPEIMSKFDKSKPYNSLPKLPPKGDIETKKILLKTIKASRALGKLNGALSNLPNPNLFIDTIQMKEAKASSEIENIITTNDELFETLIADKKNSNLAAKEILSYKSALFLGLKEIEKRPFITTNLTIKLVQEIKQNSSSIRNTPGTALLNGQGKTVYTPPTGENIIREKLANLEKFTNENLKIDPLIKMAIMHYQFEAIHPFSDGNGRTGRILLLLYLKIEQLLDIPAIYLSEYIIENKSNYYKYLREVTEKGKWENYILYMLDMIETTSIQVIAKLKSIINLMSKIELKIKTEKPKLFNKELLEIIFKLPYTKRKNLIDANLGTPKTVGNYLIALEKMGVLKSKKVGKEKLYINHQLMKALE